MTEVQLMRQRTLHTNSFELFPLIKLVYRKCYHGQIVVIVLYIVAYCRLRKTKNLKQISKYEQAFEENIQIPLVIVKITDPK